MRANDYRCELYYRKDTIGRFDVQQRIIDRLRRLEKQGKFHETFKTNWSQVETRESDGSPEAHATYQDFKDWAQANGFSLEPAFDVRPRYVPGTTEIRETVIFPVVALAIYEGDDLQAVVSSSDEFSHYTVPEALVGFERGDIDRWLSRFRGVTVERWSPHLPVSARL